jgi:peroxidase
MATFIKLFVTLSMLFFLACSTNAQLIDNFYGKTCPSLQTIVRNTMTNAIKTEARIGASILRLFFHDCFVNVR